MSTERLWRSVKYEDIYIRAYDSPRETRLGLARYFEFYNLARPHQSLGYRIPSEVYFDPELQRRRVGGPSHAAESRVAQF